MTCSVQPRGSDTKAGGNVPLLGDSCGAGKRGRVVGAMDHL